MHLIIYISEYTGSPSEIEQDLEAICSVSKKNNLRFQITGELFYHNGKFLQVIEGGREHLETLMDVICKDPRHKDVTRIVDAKVQQRMFPDWQMNTLKLEDIDSLSKESMLRFKSAFIEQCQMDSRLFIDLLISMHEDEELKRIILG